MKKILIIKKDELFNNEKANSICFYKAGSVSEAALVIKNEGPDVVVLDPKGLSEKEMSIIGKLTDEDATKCVVTEGFVDILKSTQSKNSQPETGNDDLKPDMIRDSVDSYREHSAVHKTKAFIKTNYRKNIGISEAAEEAYVSRSYLCTIFKRETGLTVIGYRDKLRIEDAADLLIYSDHKIKEIGFGLGFATPSYFCRVFRGIHGMTPKQYREKYKKKQKGQS